MVDELETALEAIEEESDLIMNEKFMMVIFQEIIDEIPSLSLYLLLVSIRVRFCHYLDFSMSSSRQRTTKAMRYLP